jgi:hypothetical protein
MTAAFAHQFAASASTLTSLACSEYSMVISWRSEMRIDVRGYARDCGWTRIASSDISDVRLPTPRNWQKSAGARLMRTKEGVTIRKAPASLTLNGRYIVEIELTKDDIRNLFLETFSDQPLSQALGQLETIRASRE